MPITIPAHGVRSKRYPEFPNDNLSPMQYRLLTDPAPIRICGAPTGAGKTYAFFAGIRALAQRVLFVVPTQALAHNIGSEARKLGIVAHSWDGAQRRELESQGLLVWVKRSQELDEVILNGGIIVTTPETLNQIWFGQPYREGYQGLPVQKLFAVDHIVIDESHLLEERALGFLSTWIILVAGRAERYRTAPKLTLLSATHSSMAQQFIDQNLPATVVSYFDEDVFNVSTANGVRYLHGDVTIEPSALDIEHLIATQLPDLMQRHWRVLLIYDSLKRYSRFASSLQQLVLRMGINPHSVFVVTGQERQAHTSLDNVAFEAGTEPQDHHRLIIGTSALEVGITYSDVTAAIIDVGLTPASLIQRIGRVARGPMAGEVYVAHEPYSDYTRVSSHYMTLHKMNGQTLDAAAFRRSFGELVPIAFKRARALSDAYWSMMRAKRVGGYRALATLYDELTHNKVPGGLLTRLRAEMSQLNPRLRESYQRWLDGIDQALTDIRGFSPTVNLQFQDGDPILYDRHWATWYLRNPDHIDFSNNRWIYHAPRDECLLDKPRPIIGQIMVPTPDRSIAVELDAWNTNKLVEDAFLQCLRRVPKVNDPNSIWYHTIEFIRATGLVVWDREDNGADVSGSLQL